MAETFKARIIGPMATSITKTLGVTNVNEITCPVQLADGQMMTCFWDRRRRYQEITGSLIGTEILVEWGDDRQDDVVALTNFTP